MCIFLTKKSLNFEVDNTLSQNETIIQKRKSRSVVGYINDVTQFAS